MAYEADGGRAAVLADDGGDAGAGVEENPVAPDAGDEQLARDQDHDGGVCASGRYP